MADLIVLKFDTTYGAQSAMSSVRALEELHYAWIDDVAIVEKHENGIISTLSPHGSVARGALYGSVIGILLFWWFPPAWFLGGWLGGIGGGALIAEGLKRAALDNSTVDKIKAELTPGTSALLLIGATGDTEEMSRAFQEHHPESVTHHSISDETLASLTKDVGILN